MSKTKPIAPAVAGTNAAREAEDIGAHTDTGIDTECAVMDAVHYLQAGLHALRAGDVCATRAVWCSSTVAAGTIAEPVCAILPRLALSEEFEGPELHAATIRVVEDAVARIDAWLMLPPSER